MHYEIGRQRTHRILPMLMCEHMMNATLEGRKTVTRRMSNRWANVNAGDILWLRETWRDVVMGDGPSIQYRCDGNVRCLPARVLAQILPDDEAKYPFSTANLDPNQGKWRPSIFMPRWACRQLLRITTKPYRQPVSKMLDPDFEAEGIDVFTPEHLQPSTIWDDGREPQKLEFYFQDTWNTLNSDALFEFDPEPFVIEFELMELDYDLLVPKVETTGGRL